MVRGIPKRRSRANNCAWSQVSVVTVCWERFEIAKNRHHHHRVIKREVRFAGLPVAVCSVLSSPYRSIGRGRLFVRSFARSGVSIQPRDFVMPLSLSLSLSLPDGWRRCAARTRTYLAVPYRGKKLPWCPARPRAPPRHFHIVILPLSSEPTAISSKMTLCGVNECTNFLPGPLHATDRARASSVRRNPGQADPYAYGDKFILLFCIAKPFLQQPLHYEICAVERN